MKVVQKLSDDSEEDDKLIHIKKKIYYLNVVLIL
jgi:hypothetical protein